MSIFKSLRSRGRKSSMQATDFGPIDKEQAPEPSTAANLSSPKASSNSKSHTLASPAADVTASPAGPKSPKPERPGSLKSSGSKLFSSGSLSRRKSNSSSSESRPAPSPRSGSHQPTLSKVTDEDDQLAKIDDGASLPPAEVAPPPGSRPSDLFAGKGVAWGQIDLVHDSPSSTSTPNSKADELQSFLKARRQWIPTFVTESKEDVDVKPVSKPGDIAFSATPAGQLLSLQDLDESHTRKQKLLGGLEQSEGWLETDDIKTSSAGTASLGAPFTATGDAQSKTLLSPASALTASPSPSTPAKPNTVDALGTTDSPLAGRTKSNSVGRKPVPSPGPNLETSAPTTNGNAQASDSAATSRVASQGGSAAVTEDREKTASSASTALPQQEPVPKADKAGTVPTAKQESDSAVAAASGTNASSSSNNTPAQTQSAQKETSVAQPDAQAHHDKPEMQTSAPSMLTPQTSEPRASADAYLPQQGVAAASTTPAQST